MNDQDFSTILNNSKDLTVGQIFKLGLRLKYKTMALFVAIFLAITGSAYVAGQSNIQQETAVMLHSPFSMRIDLNETTYDFDSLTLIEDPMMPDLIEGQVMLSLRQIRSSFDIIPIGQVLARVDVEKSLPVWNWMFSAAKINTAWARIKAAFNWNSHESDYGFREKHIDRHTIHRYYSDGCVLGYNLDNNRRSIPASFVWIERTH